MAYGIRDGHVIHISELTEEDIGEKCHCVCPSCRGILLAKGVSEAKHKRQRHFAHKGTGKCDLYHAQQTGLHLLAKEIIQGNHEILVPELSVSRKDIVDDNMDYSLSAAVRVDIPRIPAMRVSYSAVELEKSINDIRADAFVSLNGTPCIIEIAVTHFIDEEKKKKLDSIHLLTLEIDLSNLVNQTKDRKSIVDAVLFDETNRYWIVNPKRELLVSKKRAEFNKMYNEYNLKREREEREKEEHKQKSIAALKELFYPEKYSNEIRRLRNDNAAFHYLSKVFLFSNTLRDCPFFMDIPITGEFVFPCDRRIWQGKLFFDYVYNCFGQNTCTFRIPQIVNRIFGGELIIKYDKQKAYSTVVSLGGEDRKIYLPDNVIRKYFDYLELLGFITRAGSAITSHRLSSLDPPNQQSAIVMKGAIESVNPFAPNVDQLLKQALLLQLPEEDKSIVLSWDTRQVKQ